MPHLRQVGQASRLGNEFRWQRSLGPTTLWNILYGRGGWLSSPDTASLLSAEAGNVLCGQLGNRTNCLVVAGSVQLSPNGKSRVSREAQARFCEGLGVQLP